MCRTYRHADRVVDAGLVYGWPTHDHFVCHRIILVFGHGTVVPGELHIGSWVDRIPRLTDINRGRSPASVFYLFSPPFPTAYFQRSMAKLMDTCHVVDRVNGRTFGRGRVLTRQSRTTILAAGVGD